VKVLPEVRKKSKETVPCAPLGAPPPNLLGREPALVRRREIIDRGALIEEMAGIVEAAGKAEAARPQILACLKEAKARGEAEIRRRFENHAPGLSVARALSFLADQIIRLTYSHVSEQLYPLANPSKGEALSLLAVGGYGRGELAPFSDIDLLFLLPYKTTPRSEQVTEELLYFLWDLGYKVGHAVRSLDETLRLCNEDLTICTSVLEARWLWGDQELYRELRRRYRKEVKGRISAIDFIEAKLKERDARHERMGDSRYSLEPHIKDGKGGLRDLQTLYWIGKYVHHADSVSELVTAGLFTRAEALRFEKVHDFLWTLRFHLHYATGRAEERLTYDLQQELASRLNFHDRKGMRAVERLMKRYFLVAKDVGDLTRIFCAALEVRYRRRSRFRLPKFFGNRKLEGFYLEGDRIAVEKAEDFAREPIKMLEIVQVAQAHDLDIHPESLRWIRQNLRRIDKTFRSDPQAKQTFLEILTSRHDPERALRLLNGAGLLGRFLPDFGRVVAQMQYNMYHHYTVDEHTIKAVGILHRIEQGKLKSEVPIASEVVHKVVSRRVLYLAVLYHDIAKGLAGDHSVVGADIAAQACHDLALSDEETENVVWLVRHHLAMSDTAFKRDLADPKTIADFSNLVQSPERLRLLLVLTVADIRAVGPNVWNNWKAGLLRDLYWRTEEQLSGRVDKEGRNIRVEQVKSLLRERLVGWSDAELDAHFARCNAAYLLSVDPETLIRHAELVRRAEREKSPLAIDRMLDQYLDMTEITVYTADHPGLFNRIAGAMAVAGASINAARIFTLENGMALDSFHIRAATGGRFDKPAMLNRLSVLIERNLTGDLRVEKELARRRLSIPSRYSVFKVTPRVLIDNAASDSCTVIEVNGRDRPGLLYDVTRALTRAALIVKGARIGTFGEQAVDVFYVQNAVGDKITNEDRLKSIRDEVMAALEG
jgi:[protein-PII] uridylyltransferase